MLKTDVIHAPFTRRDGVMKRHRGFQGILAVAIAGALLAMPMQASAVMAAPSLTGFTVTPGDGKVTLQWSVSGGVSWAAMEYTFSFRNTETGEFSGERNCYHNECVVSSLTNGVSYEFEGSVCQEYYWRYQYVRSCSNKIYVSATPNPG